MGFVNRIIQSLEVTHNPNLTLIEQLIANDDLLPVEPEKRTWRAYNYVAFWVADMFNINMWMIVSSMIQLGMSWWQAWICVWLGQGIATPFLVLNARPGAIFHVTFPIVNRTSFGMFGSLCNARAKQHSIWYGVQASIGGSCVLVMLRAMWPSIDDLPNSMPASSGTNTRDYLCFFLFWLISLPVIWLPVHKVRHFFLVTPILMPIASMTFLIWCIVKAHGIGPIVHQSSTLHGSKLGWAMVVGTMSCVSNKVTLVTNAPDFASRARTPSAALYPQLFASPLTASFVCLIGILVSSSSQAIYGRAIWSPIELLGNFLYDNPSKATRFGVWFISASFVIAQVKLHVSVSFAVGCNRDASFLDGHEHFRELSNIRRGGYIAATVGLVMCPWNLLKTSNEFTSYLSAYSVFLSSIAGVMVTEYYVVRKGHYNVKDLYNTRKDSWAYTAYIAGILINAVGFAGATGREVPLVATRIYELSFVTGFGVSAVVYWALNRVFPVVGAADTFEEIDVSQYELKANGSQDIEEMDIDTKDAGSETASE
ncbi:permease for cytosine/purines, uracil, thiamine, allantoin-domain-containing protein [Suillus clintonianus]|uniref:permease for cytosine/purines, uracil, thiamine, allantoin-domain-containing protein n=1 Tax=Suillus clintonianus TaxID=1904413 RepID=UPI001B878356|nr:permease for cytosine/purines, uracil, thiamine, allantoin-domain-containing protein [Suillus clintonianus]KAG2124441.1 permease for cytosine/purines, uracil, thiamine, allantoin-domain-containing protein [Suillus clintonianus]